MEVLLPIIGAVLFGLGLTSLVIMLWHFSLDRDHHEASMASLCLIEIVTLVFIVLFLSAARAGLLFPALLLVPVPLIFWEFLKKSDAKRAERGSVKQDGIEIARLKEVAEKAEEPALVYKALIEIGDLYARNSEYEEAIEHYRQADEINRRYKVKGLPGLSFKIQQAEKENRIKKGEIWVCTECGYDNPGKEDTCKHCGHIRRLLKSAKADILTQKTEIRRDVWKSIFGVTALFLTVVIIISVILTFPGLPGMFVAICVFFFILYVAIKKFITW
ncbi:MAG TPA: tetratricopeptide repeat protein [bacterium]|nr:tetratricopeptide repeat protein [bacterium]